MDDLFELFRDICPNLFHVGFVIEAEYMLAGNRGQACLLVTGAGEVEEQELTVQVFRAVSFDSASFLLPAFSFGFCFWKDH